MDRRVKIALWAYVLLLLVVVFGIAGSRVLYETVTKQEISKPHKMRNQFGHY